MVTATDNLINYLSTIFHVQREDTSHLYVLKSDRKSVTISVIPSISEHCAEASINLTKGFPCKENPEKMYSLINSDAYSLDVDKLFVVVPHKGAEDLIFPIKAKLFRDRLHDLVASYSVVSRKSDYIQYFDLVLPINLLDQLSENRAFSLRRKIYD